MSRHLGYEIVLTLFVLIAVLYGALTTSRWRGLTVAERWYAALIVAESLAGSAITLWRLR